MRYFQEDEFWAQHPKQPGQAMQKSTLIMIDEARHIAGIPFKINAGFRSVEWEKKQGRTGTSSHCKGYAFDVSAKTKESKKIILSALKAVGFTRFGIYKTFIHADNDPFKPQNVTWRK